MNTKPILITAPLVKQIRTKAFWLETNLVHQEVVAIMPVTAAPEFASSIGLTDDDHWIDHDRFDIRCLILGKTRIVGAIDGRGYLANVDAPLPQYVGAEVADWTRRMRASQRIADQKKAAEKAAAKARAEEIAAKQQESLRAYLADEEAKREAERLQNPAIIAQRMAARLKELDALAARLGV
jgi:hypothetical protein